MDKIIELIKFYCLEIWFFVLLDLKYMWLTACAISKININKYASNFFLFLITIKIQYILIYPCYVKMANKL